MVAGYKTKLLFSTLLAGGELESKVFLKQRSYFFTLLGGGKLEIKVLRAVWCQGRVRRGTKASVKNCLCCIASTLIL